MGVTGLWKLIDPCGKPVPLETLEGKILAVDISIWLHQVIKGFQDHKGAALNNAHLLGLFHRLCKLLYYRIKPIFVFDGCVPQLKKDTLARRQQQRSKLNSEAERIQALLLQNLAQEQMVQQALGPNAADLLLTSPLKRLAEASNKLINKKDNKDDMFMLPDIPEEEEHVKANDSCESTEEDSNITDDNSSFERGNNAMHIYNTNLQAIDVRSQHFRNLPADVRHEILVDIKETRKQSSWGRLHEMPSRGDDFSSFQMKRLLKRRDVQVSLEEAEKDMGGRSLTYAELNELFMEDGILEPSVLNKGSKQLCSDEHTRFLLVKDLKKKLYQEMKQNEEIPKIDTSKDRPMSNNKTDNIDKKPDSDEDDIEFKNDINLAIALSLADTNNSSKVYDDKDYDFDSDESLKLTSKQKQQLKHTTKGPARTYMIEYAGMNKEEVDDIMEKTQLDSTVNSIIQELFPPTNKEEKNREYENDAKFESSETNNENPKKSEEIIINDDDDDTDSDLEEVVDIDLTEDSPISSMKINVINAKLQSAKTVSDGSKENSGKSALVKRNDDDDMDSDLQEVVNDSVTIKSAGLNIDINAKNTELHTQEAADDNSIDRLGKIEQVKKSGYSDTDSKLKEVVHSNDKKDTHNINVIVNINEPLKPDEDLFADIFENNEKLLPNTKTSSQEFDEKIPQLEKFQNNAETVQSILNQLQYQVDNVKKITLDDVKLNKNETNILEIIDNDIIMQDSKIHSDIVEICDNYSKPDIQVIKNNETPTKKHSITDYFELDYVIKRTPEKLQDEFEKTPPKITSPFFVNKIPKSETKKNDESPTNSSEKKSSKITKDLFVENFREIKMDDAQKVISEAAKVLQEEVSETELQNVAESLAQERNDLEQIRNRQERMGLNITQSMSADCQRLLKLFGIPYLVAPMEAEAQCAFLNGVQLTNGTITDDSDIWLFGGQTVYKNFFAQNKHVMEFQAEAIEKNFQCNRNKLIQLACLVGSDYTTGVNGIGAVTALEILAQFSQGPLRGEDSKEVSGVHNISLALEKFRNWWFAYKKCPSPIGSSHLLALQKKLKNIQLSECFPNTAVIEAYLTPTIDDNTEEFSWGQPDVDAIREFARQTFGWTQQKTDSILMPVIKKLNEKKTQSSILKYLNVKSKVSSTQLAVSKRVKKAIEKMNININESANDDLNDMQSKSIKPPKIKKVKKETDASKTTATATRKPRKRKQEKCNIGVIEDDNQKPPEKFSPAKLLYTKEIIPQREEDSVKFEANKKFAAEVLKKERQQIATKMTKKKRINN